MKTRTQKEKQWLPSTSDLGKTNPAAARRQTNESAMSLRSPFRLWKVEISPQEGWTGDESYALCPLTQQSKREPARRGDRLLGGAACAAEREE